MRRAIKRTRTVRTKGHTSNEPFGRWGEVVAAMIDRLVHHAEVIALKGDSYRLKNRDLGRVPAATSDEP
jgi:DNA replication protein DnaC